MSLRSRLTPSVGSWFAPRTFLLALVLAVVGVVLGGLIPVPLVDTVGRFLGLFLAAFVVGLARPGRHYLETGLAGAIAASLGFVLGTLSVGFLPVGLDFLSRYGVAVAGVGAGSGLLVSWVGHYFGRDLRAGLTMDVAGSDGSAAEEQRF